jgi:hypothetical protein
MIHSFAKASSGIQSASARHSQSRSAISASVAGWRLHCTALHQESIRRFAHLNSFTVAHPEANDCWRADMIAVDFELVRQLQDERKSEAAAHRLLRCLPGAKYSRATQWLSFRAARELLARIRDFVGVAAKHPSPQWQRGVPQ